MAEKADWRMSKQDLNDIFADDAKFDELLLAGLKPVSPPEDFSARVMAAIAAEAEPAPVAHRTSGKIISFPWRRFAAGLGTCAAAVALFVGVSVSGAGDDPAALLAPKPVQVAENIEPKLTAPTTKTVEADLPIDSEKQTTDNTSAAATNPSTSTDNTQVSAPHTVGGQNSSATTSDDVPLPVQSDKLVLPRTAYGTETEGTLAKRLLATVEGNRIYQPSFAGKNAVFNTADDNNMYSWRVDLSNPSEPQIAAMAAWEDLPSKDEVLQNTTAPVDSTTVVTSPDKTMLAQNSADGLWISLLDGDVFKLTEEGSGKLLAWSLDSSKLVFTNESGALFVGYPFERRIYQLADGGVTDVCWHSNNKTLLYVDDDALYIVETY